MTEQSEHFEGDNEPLYNIGAVSRMADVAETTLRVWERRYDFPNSSRTDGGHRLYSQNEVSRLQWVKERIDKGIQVSQAIKALHQMEQERSSHRVPIPPTNDAGFAAFYDRLLNALLANNTSQSERTIAEALTVYSLEYFILNIVSPIMSELGNMWKRGEVDIATEHFATNFLRFQLLRWMQTAPPPYNVKPIVLTCAPEELHEGSLLILGVLLRRLRWPVNYLGQMIVLQDLMTYVQVVKPSAIVFVAMTQKSAKALSEWPHWLPKVYESGRPSVCFGGRVFTENPDYVDHVPGIFLGQSLEDGISTLNRLLIDIYPSAR